MSQWGAHVTLFFAQVASFDAAKDYVLLALVGVVASLLGAAWADLRGKIQGVESRLDEKIEQDRTGYERLTRCEERLAESTRRLDRLANETPAEGRARRGKSEAG